jgi:hypothetical protein
VCVYVYACDCIYVCYVYACVCMHVRSGLIKKRVERAPSPSQVTPQHHQCYSLTLGLLLPKTITVRLLSDTMTVTL